MSNARAEGCLDENTIAEYIEGRLSETRLGPAEAHLDRCPTCRELVVQGARLRPPAAGRAGDDGSPAIGEVVAERYRIEESIGSGGMGVVFAATHLLLDKKVALKLMRLDALASPAAIDRFVREGRASDRLHSEHATRVLDLGRLPNGAPYIVMELLDGEDLGRRVARDGPLSAAAAAGCLVQACEAIGEAHRLGLVHRDIKPSNLFLTRGGDGKSRIKVLDFGLAKDTGAGRDLELTRTSAVLGSPFFMAPEQLQSSGEVDARADVWALGATLQYLVTGLPPFEASSFPELSAAVLRDAPRSLPPGVDGRLAPILAACLQKDRHRRMGSAAELAAALAPLAAMATPAPARPLAARSRAARGRRALIAAVALTAGAALAAVAVIATRGIRGPSPAGTGAAPVVVLMDTPVARGVYDPDTVARGGTNADELNDRLRDLPVTLVKEALPSTWNREAHVLGLRPDLVVVHRSAFFHALNVEFGYPYPPFPDARAETMWRLLYRTADDKLIAFIGLVGTAHPHTRFLVYSRGTDGFWPDPGYRRRWVTAIEQRFPALKGRLQTLFIAGGVKTGTFRNPTVSDEIRGQIAAMLGLRPHRP